MATYWTDFSEYTNGQNLITADWTEEWHTTSTLTAFTGTGTLGDAYATFGGTADNRHFISWDDVPVLSGDVEVLYRFYLEAAHSTGAGAWEAGATIYGSGSSTSETGYVTAFGTLGMSTGEWTSSIPSTIENETPDGVAPTAQTWYWCKFQVVSGSPNTVRAKYWTGDVVDDEPVTWTTSGTHTGHTSGDTGLYSLLAANVRYDYFAVGSAGDSAPLPQRTFVTDFSEYPNGTNIRAEDWTNRWHGPVVSTTVKPSGTIGDARLEYNSDTDHSFVSWDKLDTVLHGDLNFLVHYTPNFATGVTETTPIGVLGFDGSGTTATESGYVMGFSDAGAIIGYWSSAVWTTLAEEVGSQPANGTGLWIRGERAGTTLRMRYWTGAVTSEPGTWTLTTTDSTYTSGWAGISGYANDTGNAKYDYFAVGVGSGVAAPAPDVDATQAIDATAVGVADLLLQHNPAPFDTTAIGVPTLAHNVFKSLSMTARGLAQVRNDQGPVPIVLDGQQINDARLAFYQANGATAGQINDAEYQFLVAQGIAPGELNDMWFAYLSGPAGCPLGARRDMMYAYWNGQCGIVPFGPPVDGFESQGVIGATGTGVADLTFTVTIEDEDMIGDTKESLLTEAQFIDQLPDGHKNDWVLADGRDVSGSMYETITGEHHVPDLRGAFLRMAGYNTHVPHARGWDGGPLGDYGHCKTAMPLNHQYTIDVQVSGNHRHSLGWYEQEGQDILQQYGNHTAGNPSAQAAHMYKLEDPATGGSQAEGPEREMAVSTDGQHGHTATIVGGDDETCSDFYAVNIFIRVN
jgi:hypothetical protein